MQPTLVFLPEKSHGQWSLQGCSPYIAKSRAQLTHSTCAWVYMPCTMSGLVSLYIDVNVYSELSGDSL